MKLKSLLTISLAFFLMSCASTPEPTLTPAEIQSMQTRQYEEGKDIVFASVISVFQDLGYQIASEYLPTTFLGSSEAVSAIGHHLRTPLRVDTMKQKEMLFNK